MTLVRKRQASHEAQRAETKRAKLDDKSSASTADDSRITRSESESVLIFSRAASFFSLEDWKPLLATESPFQWIVSCAREWSLSTAYIDWSSACKNAKWWMAPLLDQNPNIDWMQFLFYLDDDQKWKLPILLKRVHEFKWNHWQRLSETASEWMIPLLEKHADKIDLKYFFGLPVCVVIQYREHKFVDPDIPEWKQSLVKRCFNHFKFQDVCRLAKPWMEEELQANFDRIDIADLFENFAPWKAAFLKKNKDRFDWENANSAAWKMLSKYAEEWMPLQEHFDKVDILTLIRDNRTYLFHEYAFIKANVDRINWKTLRSHFPGNRRDIFKCYDKLFGYTSNTST